MRPHLRMLKAKIWIHKHNCLFLCLLFLLFLSFIHTCNCPSDTCTHHLTQSAVSKNSPCIRGKSSTHLELGEQEIVKKNIANTQITTLEHIVEYEDLDASHYSLKCDFIANATPFLCQLGVMQYVSSLTHIMWMISIFILYILSRNQTQMVIWQDRGSYSMQCFCICKEETIFVLCGFFTNKKSISVINS